MYRIFKCLEYLFFIPHYFAYLSLSKEIKELVDSDVYEMNRRKKQQKGLLHYLNFHAPYRNLFYWRVGGRKAQVLKLFAKEYPLFTISPSLQKWGKYAYVLNHPYGTIINAKCIGDNFTICQLTTLGNKQHGINNLIPNIGSNVRIGANVNIVGGVIIGNNVDIGAGSVVVKDVPIIVWLQEILQE